MAVTIGVIAPPPEKWGEILNGDDDQDEILVINSVTGNHTSQLLCSE